MDDSWLCRDCRRSVGSNHNKNPIFIRCKPGLQKRNQNQPNPNRTWDLDSWQALKKKRVNRKTVNCLAKWRLHLQYISSSCARNQFPCRRSGIIESCASVCLGVLRLGTWVWLSIFYGPLLSLVATYIHLQLHIYIFLWYLQSANSSTRTPMLKRTNFFCIAIIFLRYFAYKGMRENVTSFIN